METTGTQEIKNSKVWLQRLKDESWEAELLISTVAIVGTVQFFKLIDWGVTYFINMLPPNEYIIGFSILFVGVMAISILATFFVIHFLLRAYWVGLVGLNSVFPDYNLKDSPYSELYTSKMSNLLPKLKHTIQDVDDLCSVIFSAAFFLFGMYVYFSIIGLVLLYIYQMIKDVVPSVVWVVLGVVLLVIYILYMIFLFVANTKKYKKNDSVQELFFKAVKWSNFILIGPLYKYVMQIAMMFGTNFKTRKSIIIFLLFFTFVGIGFSTFKLSNSKISFLLNQQDYYSNSSLYSNYYADKANKEAFLLAPQIESDIVEKSLLKLFIPLYGYEDKLMDRQYEAYQEDENLSRNDKRESRRKWYLDRAISYHELKINDVPVEVDLMRFNMPVTNQRGLLGYVNLQGGMGQEKNMITITKKINDNEKEWNIPFFYLEK